MQNPKNIIRYQKTYWNLTANSLAMITTQQNILNYKVKMSIKSHAKMVKYYQLYKQEIRNNYIEEISIKSDEKKKK